MYPHLSAAAINILSILTSSASVERFLKMEDGDFLFFCEGDAAEEKDNEEDQLL